MMMSNCGFELRRKAASLVCFVGLVGAFCGASLAAQEKASGSAPEGAQSKAAPTTLHAYENLIQIPVLVLSPSKDRLPDPIPPSKFSVSFDSGPSFRATHVRRQGDDPISLAILVDARDPQTELLPKFDEAVAGLIPEGLRPHDHVSIYVMFCSEVRASKAMADDPAKLKLAVNTALQSWTNRGPDKKGPECQHAGHLWNVLAYVTQVLSGEPGRRVILAITDGEDRGSTHTWNELKTFAQSTGVTIFGLKDTVSFMRGANMQSRFDEKPLQSVSELSGGTVFLANRSNLDETLKLFMTMLRERYIVEFPRPSNSTAGAHSIDVRVDKSNYFVRAAGNSVPIADPGVLADPSTVPTDPSLAPTMGKRQILTPQ
jgi:VWFA-related protein